MVHLSICHPFLDGYTKCHTFPSSYCNMQCHNRNPDVLGKLLTSSKLRLHDVEEIICTSIAYNSVKNLSVLLEKGPAMLSRDSMFVFIFRELIQQSAWSTLWKILEDQTVKISQEDIISCLDIIIPFYRPEVHKLLLNRCIPMRWPNTTLRQFRHLQGRSLGHYTKRFLMAIELFHRHLDPGGPWHRS